MGALLEEVVGPDVVAALGSQPDAGSVIQPQACALGLPGGDLQPLASPDPFDPLVVDQPAGPPQQLGDLAIAVAAILPGQLDDVGGQPLFILTAPRHLALRRGRRSSTFCCGEASTTCHGPVVTGHFLARSKCLNVVQSCPSKRCFGTI